MHNKDRLSAETQLIERGMELVGLDRIACVVFCTRPRSEGASSEIKIDRLMSTIESSNTPGVFQSTLVYLDAPSKFQLQSARILVDQSDAAILILSNICDSPISDDLIYSLTLDMSVLLRKPTFFVTCYQDSECEARFESMVQALTKRYDEMLVHHQLASVNSCLLYTSDAADE